jgi:hypothetical protein
VSAFDDLVADMDRAVMAELGGEPVVYRPGAGDAVTVTGVFDAQYVLAQGDAEAGVEASAPAVFLRLADLPTDPELDEPTLTIRGTDYHVNDRKPDGAGGLLLTLRKVT